MKIITRCEYRYLCPTCRQPKRYDLKWAHKHGQLVYRCLAGHAWLAWKDIYLERK